MIKKGPLPKGAFFLGGVCLQDPMRHLPFCGGGGITCNSLLMNCRYCLTAQFVLRQTRTPVFAVEPSADG